VRQGPELSRVAAGEVQRVVEGRVAEAVSGAEEVGPTGGAQREAEAQGGPAQPREGARADGGAILGGDGDGDGADGGAQGVGGVVVVEARVVGGAGPHARAAEAAHDGDALEAVGRVAEEGHDAQRDGQEPRA
jgi:hypothetical protein